MGKPSYQSNQTNIESPPEDLLEVFWQQSCDFYANDNVKNLLLELQDQHGYSVNRLLFSLWFSQLFQQLVDAKLLNSATGEILKCESSVQELRLTRKRLETTFGETNSSQSEPKVPLAGNLKITRNHLLEAELGMEKEIQARLVIHLCNGKYPPVRQISAETLDFLISENITLLNQHRTSTEESKLQELSMLWIQTQDCYN